MEVNTKTTGVDFTQKGPGSLGALSMLSLALMGMGSTVLTPALATLAEHYVGRDVSFVQTLATLGVVAGSLIAGAIMGKYVKIKTLAIIGNILCLVLGVLPVFFDHYLLLLTSRLLFGFALGLIAPLGNALIMQFYHNEKRSSMLGFGTMAMNIGGIIFQQLGGILAARNWQMSFWGHGFFIVAVVMALFIPKEPEVTPEMKAALANAPKEKMNIKMILFIGMLLLIFQTVNMSVMMCASILFIARNAGGAVVAATALTLYTVAGMVAGVVFGKIFGALKRAMLFVDFLIVALGAFVILAGQSAAVMSIGFILIGLGFNWVFSTTVAWIGMATPPSTIGSGTSIVVALMNLGGFLCSFWMILLGQDLTKIIVADIVLGVVFAVILLFINPFTAKKVAA